ncbi:MAG: transcription elongation factor GreA [Chloroflexi bacterium OLB14]|nr:MAG: transcription elongation factor GreA [Chloroflexi bacterium OLB14]
MTTNFLTKEGFNKLQEELDHLRTKKRQEVADRLHEAMEGGELIENAEYEAAKNEQAFVEGRIQELDVLLASAQIIEENGKHKKSDGVQVGSKVTIKEGNYEAETFYYCGRSRSQPTRGKNFKRVTHWQSYFGSQTA